MRNWTIGCKFKLQFWIFGSQLLGFLGGGAAPQSWTNNLPFNPLLGDGHQPSSGLQGFPIKGRMTIPSITEWKWKKNRKSKKKKHDHPQVGQDHPQYNETTNYQLPPSTVNYIVVKWPSSELSTSEDPLPDAEYLCRAGTWTKILGKAYILICTAMNFRFYSAYINMYIIIAVWTSMHSRCCKHGQTCVLNQCAKK